MTQTTSLWNLPVWAVLLLAIIVGLTVFNIVDSITKIWRYEGYPENVSHMNPYQRRKKSSE